MAWVSAVDIERLVAAAIRVKQKVDTPEVRELLNVVAEISHDTLQLHEMERAVQGRTSMERIER